MPRRSFEDLVAVMHRLRRSCPWDREQTIPTLRQYVLEEAYEVVDAIEHGTAEKLAEECGDLLFEVVFISEIAQESGGFEIGEVITRIHDKLVRRHPHVFGDLTVESAAHVVRNWEAIKDAERAAASHEDAGAPSALDGLPLALPALARASKLGARAARAGFDWRSAPSIVDKIGEELQEIRAAASQDDTAAVGREIGDLLFAAAQLARFLSLDSEDLAREACRRFEERFRHMEAELGKLGRKLSDLDDAELDRLWERAKSRAS